MSDRRGKPDRSTTPIEVWMVDAEGRQAMPDRLATEEPLEIRLATASGIRTVAVTMRTPGADEELAAGFLFNEAVVEKRQDILRIVPPSTQRGAQLENVVHVELGEGLDPDLAPLERHFFTTSACGVCGKASLDMLHVQRTPLAGDQPRVTRETLFSLPRPMRSAQGIFQATGGLHAAALFTPEGDLVAAREDVGRHNALDKLVGWALLEDRLPFSAGIVVVSGRASYEILQKCLMAGAPIVCAVSAPSSLAVSMAREFGVTLVGFLRDDRLNVYSGAQRLAID